MHDWEAVIAIWSMGGILVFLLHHIAGIAVIMGKRESGKNNFLGIAILYRKREYFSLAIKDAIIKRAETTEYRVVFRNKFVKENYMEELILEIAGNKISCRIDHHIDFTVKGLRIAISSKI